MAGLWDAQQGGGRPADAAALASEILARADRDMIFVLHLVGESQNLMLRHFVKFIEAELAGRGIGYGAHPLLRPFIETHARELTDLVAQGIGLRHQFGVRTFETMSGDPSRLLRVDLWDTMQGCINDAERHFVSGVGGLQRILAQIEAET